jgi:hypothetical protein
MLLAALWSNCSSPEQTCLAVSAVPSSRRCWFEAVATANPVHWVGDISWSVCRLVRQHRIPQACASKSGGWFSIQTWVRCASWGNCTQLGFAVRRAWISHIAHALSGYGRIKPWP